MKVTHPHNSGFTVRIVLKLHNEGGQEVHGNYINDFYEKKNLVRGKSVILGRPYGPFKPKYDASSQLWICSMGFFNFAQ